MGTTMKKRLAVHPPKLLALAALLAAVGGVPVAWAQLALPSTGAADGLGAGLPGVGAGTASGAGAARPSNSLLWRATSTVYVSDNIGNNDSTQGKDAGALLRVGPGVAWQRSTAGLQASVDYSLFAQRYVKSPQIGSDLQHALRAGLRADLLPNRLSVEAQASISQQNRSAFEVQQAAGNFGNANSNEVASLGLAPRWRSRLGGDVELEASHQMTATRVKDSVTGDGLSQTTSVGVRNATRQRLGWSSQLVRQVNAPKASRRTESVQARLGLNWVPDVDWSASAFAGQERSDFASQSQTSGAIYGATLNWNPSPRTRATLGGEHRVFANLYTASVDHRFSRAAIRLSDSRSVNQPGLVGGLNNASNYDLLFAQLAGQEPDVIRRDALVRSTLQSQGLDPNARAANGFLAGQATVARQQQLAMAYQFVRTTFGAALSRTRTSRLDPASTAVDDLSNSAFVNTQAVALNAGYRLTPQSALSLTGSWQENKGDSSGLRTELRSLSLTWSARLGQRTQLQLTARHNDFASTLRPYVENAVLGTLQQQF